MRLLGLSDGTFAFKPCAHSFLLGLERFVGRPLLSVYHLLARFPRGVDARFAPAPNDVVLHRRLHSFRHFDAQESHAEANGLSNVCGECEAELAFCGIFLAEYAEVVVELVVFFGKLVAIVGAAGRRCIV